MRSRILLPLLLLAAGCAASTASSTRPATMPQPQVTIDQPAPIFFGSGFEAPLTLRVEVLNSGKDPLRVREIEVTSPGMGQYEIYPLRRYFNEEIAPGETKLFTLPAMAWTDIRRLTPTEPLSLRTIIRFETGDVRFREVYFTRGVGIE